MNIILSQIHISIALIYFTILHMISKSMMIGQLPVELTLIKLSYFESSRIYRQVTFQCAYADDVQFALSKETLTACIVVDVPLHCSTLS